MRDTQGEKLISTNKKAFHNYHISDRYETGIVLVGTEVKSIREGRINFKDSYAVLRDAELWLIKCHISPYSHGNRENHDPTRSRKLLVHKQEIRRLIGKVAERGFTLVPLRMYLKRGLVKVEIGLAKGKKQYDKREAERGKSMDREARAAIRRSRKN